MAHVAPNAQESSNRAHFSEDNEAVLKIIIKGRSRHMRHVSLTHRVNFDCLYERFKIWIRTFGKQMFRLTNRSQTCLRRVLSYVISGRADDSAWHCFYGFIIAVPLSVVAYFGSAGSADGEERPSVNCGATPTFSTSFVIFIFSGARRMRVIFRLCCCATIFSIILFLVEMEEPYLDGSSPILGALKSTSVSRHA